MPDLDYDHVVLRAKVLQFQGIEKMLLGLGNQRRALGEDFPAIMLAAVDEAIERIRPLRTSMLTEIRRVVKGGRIDGWIRGTHGLGPGLWLLLGSMPALAEFGGPAGVWKYAGLHVDQGKAPRPREGQRLGFAPFRRAYAIKRVAEPVVKVGGPYRKVYDDRRARTLESHPPMLNGDGDLLDPLCPHCIAALQKTTDLREEKSFTRERKAPSLDCSAAGGVHWTDGHRHADALRVTAKAILLDAWRVAHGLTPRVSSSEAVLDDRATPELGARA